MAAANPKWGRYILASFAKHLHAIASDANLPLVVEGVDDRNAAFMSAKHRVEVSIIGPNTREQSPKYHRVTVDVFCYLTSQMGGANYNAGDHRDFAGLLQNALDQAIEIRSYEPGNNSPALIGCVAPRTGANDQVTITPLRTVDTDKQSHSVIEARLVGNFQQ